MNWKDILIVGAMVAVVLVVVIGGMLLMLQHDTKIIEGEVIDVEIHDDGLVSYWEICFKDGTTIKARASSYGTVTYDFVKNSRVSVHFTRSKYLHNDFWTVESIIKLPDLVEGE